MIYLNFTKLFVQKSLLTRKFNTSLAELTALCLILACSLKSVFRMCSFLKKALFYFRSFFHSDTRGLSYLLAQLSSICLTRNIAHKSRLQGPKFCRAPLYSQTHKIFQVLKIFVNQYNFTEVFAHEGELGKLLHQ